MQYKFSAATAIAAIMATSPAFAQVTPEEVWESLISPYTDTGYKVTVGSKDETGGNLTLTDIAFNADLDDAAVAIAIPKFTLQQTGDGKVRSVSDGDMKIVYSNTNPAVEDIEMEMVVSFPGNETITSGSKDDLLHEFSGDGITVGITELYSNTSDLKFEPVQADKPLLSITSGEYKGQYTDTSVSGGRDMAFEMDHDAVSIDLNAMFEDASNLQNSADIIRDVLTMVGQVKLDGLSAVGQTHTPSDMAETARRLDLMLKAGYRTQGKFVTGPMTGGFSFELDETGRKSSVDGAFSSGPFELEVGGSEKGLSYKGTSGSTSADINVSDLPFPISYEVESSHFDVLIPVLKSDEPQPFKYVTGFTGLTVSDDIWDLFDPEGLLSRDPANLNVDIAGTVDLALDLFDPKLNEMAPGGTLDHPGGLMPFEPKSIKVNQLQIQAVGIDADVSGDITTTGPNFTPVGTLEGNVTGLNALLDNLVKLGLIPQDQVMGARMMIAMFAEPVEGDPDNLHTKLEFKEGGSVFANGQQIK